MKSSFEKFKKAIQKAKEIKYLGFSEVFDIEENCEKLIENTRNMILIDYELNSYNTSKIELINKNSKEIITLRKNSNVKCVKNDNDEYIFNNNGFIFYIKF